jgi:hypothetical protein
MNIALFLKDAGAGQWLALAVLIAAYLRRLTAPDSKFPVSLPPAWQPVATAVVGAVYAGIISFQGGMTAENAILATVLTAGAAGVADMVVVAIFGDPLKAPGWARAIVFLFDDLTGGGRIPPAPLLPHIGSKRPSKEPTTDSSTHVQRTLCFLALGLACASCGLLTAAIPGIISIADAECTQAEKSPEPGWVDFICTVLTPKPGEAKQFTYRVKADDAVQFASMHAPKSVR